MKILSISLFLFLMLPLSASAGYYGNSSVNDYDPITGIYYKSIEIEQENKGFLSKGSSSIVTNIAIFNPKTEKYSLLFKDKKKRNISILLYETGEKDGVMKYYNSGYSDLIKNNVLAISRPPRDKLLVGVRVERNEQVSTELWESNKHGDKLRLLTSFPASSNWHLDVRNSKIRIVSSKNGKFSQKSVKW